MSVMRKPMKPVKPMKNASRAGYTLLEVLIAMVVLMLSFLAIIAAQTSSMQGYISSRDNAAASEMAKRIVEVVRIEAQQWRDGSQPPTATSVSAAYSKTTLPPFDVQPVLPTLVADNWGGWIRLFDTPADVSFARSGIDAKLLGGRYCAFVRGGPMLSGMQNLNGAAGSGIVQMHVAIVYPGATASLTTCGEGAGGIDPAAIDDGKGLMGETLESTGLRVNYFAFNIASRDYL